MDTLDVRGLSCPLPVLRTKKEIDKGVKELQVLGSGSVAKQNVTKFARSCQLEVVMVTDGEDEWEMVIKGPCV